jgi:hypothetical protein
MKARMVGLTALLGMSMMCFAVADGSWLKKVPQAGSRASESLRRKTGCRGGGREPLSQ